MQATKKPHNYHKTVVWQKDDRIRKSPLKFYVYYYSELSGDCQVSIFTELWRLSVAFCVTLWHMSIKGRDVVTEPKTPKSNRVIQMPAFLGEEIQEHIKTLYGIKPTDRIFPVTKSYLYREMVRGAKAAGVKKIRIHDLRHSHISLLIDMGFTALAIADRVGHESIDITYRYAHLFPTRQQEMAQKLNMERGDF